MIPEILDITPIPTPALVKAPVGTPVNFEKIVADAGMRNVVTLSKPLDIRLYAGTRDLKAVAPGKVAYCIGIENLPVDPSGQAREIMRRLAYAYHDWAAREIVGRYHRDIKRLRTVVHGNNNEKLKLSVKLKRLIAHGSGDYVENLAKKVDGDVAIVGAIIQQWADANIVTCEQTQSGLWVSSKPLVEPSASFALR